MSDVGFPRKNLPQKKVNYIDFLNMYDATHTEWVDGEVVDVSPASVRHQDIVKCLTALLLLFVESRSLGWVCAAPFNMRLPQTPSGREPDVLFVRETRRHLIKPGYLDGPADLVIEVTWPESADRDRGVKYREYEAAGIGEYWLIDPDGEQVQLYRLAEAGRYVETAAQAGVIRSTVIPGFWLREAWLQGELPRVIDMARELGVV